ncbi:acyltransferase [Caulobacter sp. 17J65-9]|uniref:acyltransferase family protein n=1 Tax=Caulobacter sp. 17J65-9 TaxID=2709382 RepID=UPI0013C85012|nr:acyltransferase [Caulobacter sp. 17J65-9]NEX92308.1 acyltransferase [Caulobacter sp. 17J65-9]
MTSKTTDGYLPSLTAMRGVAAVWVMLFHIDVSLFYRDLGPLIPHAWTGLITGGYLWVDFFFILSGFVIAHVYGADFAGGVKLRTAFGYLKARFFRIYPLHLFTLLVLIVFARWVAASQPALIDGSLESFFSDKALPSNFLLTNAMNQHVYLSWNIVSWSIGAEWWTYFVGIGLLAATGRAWSGALLLIGGYLLLAALVLLLPAGDLDITFDYGFFRCLFGFAMGVGLHALYRRGWARAWLASDAAVVAVLLLLAMKFHWGWHDLVAPPLFALLALAGAYNRAGFARLLAARPPQYLGEISYSIYLMHGVWFMVFWTFLPRLKTAFHLERLPPAWSLAYAVLFVALSIGSAALTHRFVEAPGRRLFRARRTLAVASA